MCTRLLKTWVLLKEHDFNDKFRVLQQETVLREYNTVYTTFECCLCHCVNTSYYTFAVHRKHGCYPRNVSWRNTWERIEVQGDMRWWSHSLWMTVCVSPHVKTSGESTSAMNRIKLVVINIIQILTGTVMKYHVSVDWPRELYFPKGLYCPEGNDY